MYKIVRFYFNKPGQRRTIAEHLTLEEAERLNPNPVRGGIKKFIKYCQEKDAASGRPYTSRYIGSLVSDFHRNLIVGGVFLYPPNEKAPQGKLRLLYECNPISFISEQAGGKASDGLRRILDLVPGSLHVRSPFYTGSIKMVEKIEEFLKKHH